MSKIKLPDANFLASFVRCMRMTGEKPCPHSSDGNSMCNSSTVLTSYALANVGFSFNFYKGPRCPHTYAASGAQIAYMLDNYAAPAVKAPCDPSWKGLLHGSVAILMYQNVFGNPHQNALDVWSIDGGFHDEILEQGAAKSLWIWTLGKAENSKIKAKHSHHKAKHALTLF